MIVWSSEFVNKSVCTSVYTFLKQKEKGLSTGEKKMLVNAKQILVSELVLAEQSNKDEMEELVENKINNSFMLFRGNEQVKENVVEKFIPFDSEEITGLAENN